MRAPNGKADKGTTHHKDCKLCSGIRQIAFLFKFQSNTMWFFVYILVVILELDIATSSNATFDVMKFGAAGNGITDDTKAFESAWTAACNITSWDTPMVTVPSGMTFLVSPIKFQGPCKSASIIFEILGTIVARPKGDWGVGEGEWLFFNQVEGLSVVGRGQGVIDGRGETWWGYGDPNNSPTALKFDFCNQLQIVGLKHKNSQRNHISLDGCNNSNITGVNIYAPPTSPNTDGIDISSLSNLRIQDTNIQTGDDCIAVNGGTSDIYISRVTCGPGHGISIGSLGQGGKREEVEKIAVDNCTFINTLNGVRIKTWQGGLGFARNITFSNIVFQSADNPIIIDQYYCPHQTCDTQPSAVQISDIKYMGLRGTSVRGNGTINLSCSETVPCTGLVVSDLNLKGADGTTMLSASCINAHGTYQSSTPVVDCLKP